MGKKKGQNPDNVERGRKMLMVLTKGRLSELKTIRGGFTRATLRLLGVDWPPERGWKKQLLGSEVDGDTFLEAREARLTRSNGQRFNEKTRVPKQKKRRRKRAYRPLGERWRSLTTTEQRLGYLKKLARIPQVPHSERTKRRSRRRLRPGRCACCGEFRRLVHHHAVMLSSAGPDTRSNMVHICGDCHVEIHPWMKHSPVNEEWIETDSKEMGLTYE